MNFWRVRKDNDHSGPVNEALISQFAIRMEQLDELPPVIFVGLTCKVADEGAFCYSIEGIFHITRAPFEPVRGHGWVQEDRR